MVLTVLTFDVVSFPDDINRLVDASRHPKEALGFVMLFSLILDESD